MSAVSSLCPVGQAVRAARTLRTARRCVRRVVSRLHLRLARLHLPPKGRPRRIRAHSFRPLYRRSTMRRWQQRRASRAWPSCVGCARRRRRPAASTWHACAVERARRLRRCSAALSARRRGDRSSGYSGAPPSCPRGAGYRLGARLGRLARHACNRAWGGAQARAPAWVRCGLGGSAGVGLACRVVDRGEEGSLRRGIACAIDTIDLAALDLPSGDRPPTLRLLAAPSSLCLRLCCAASCSDCRARSSVMSLAAAPLSSQCTR